VSVKSFIRQMYRGCVPVPFCAYCNRKKLSWGNEFGVSRGEKSE